MFFRFYIVGELVVGIRFSFGICGEGIYGLGFVDIGEVGLCGYFICFFWSR